ncbi:MAG: hypothetical protein F6J86_09300 [Symploca sp. SIO1B1]|nr:hypothetical protein [Symploca sp. SIO1B1]
MSKLTAAKSTLLIVVVGILSLSALPLQAAIRQQINPSLTEVNHKHIALTWGDIWDRVRRKKGKNGSRGDDKNKLLCLITPGKLRSTDENGAYEKGTIKVWGEQPLFLWQGVMEGIEVRHLRSNELIWSQTLEPTTNRITYQGEELEPEQVYFWRETVPLDTLPTKITFRIMNKEDRDRISTELAELESQLETEGASESDITLARVTYFANLQLWSDALQAAYSVENPSGELADFIAKFEAHNFCPSEEGD